MGKVLVVFILDKSLSALLKPESKLIVAACRDASVIRGISEFVRYELKRAEILLSKMKKTVPSVTFFIYGFQAIQILQPCWSRLLQDSDQQAQL
jgi:hypothetical protein